MIVYTSTLQIITPTTFPSGVPGEKPVTSQSLIHYSLQLVCQFWFHILKLVTSQPMFQLFTQLVYQVMGLIVLKSFIIASTLVYNSHKPCLSLPVPISVPLSCHFNHSALLLILNQPTVFFQPMMLVL